MDILIPGDLVGTILAAILGWMLSGFLDLDVVLELITGFFRFINS